MEEEIAAAQEVDKLNQVLDKLDEDVGNSLFDDAYGLSDNQKSKLHHDHPVNPYEPPVHQIPGSTVSVSPPGEVRPSMKF